MFTATDKLGETYAEGKDFNWMMIPAEVILETVRFSKDNKDYVEFNGYDAYYYMNEAVMPIGSKPKITARILGLVKDDAVRQIRFAADGARDEESYFTKRKLIDEIKKGLINPDIIRYGRPGKKLR